MTSAAIHASPVPLEAEVLQLQPLVFSISPPASFVTLASTGGDASSEASSVPPSVAGAP